MTGPRTTLPLGAVIALATAIAVAILFCFIH